MWLFELVFQFIAELFAYLVVDSIPKKYRAGCLAVFLLLGIAVLAALFIWSESN